RLFQLTDSDQLRRRQGADGDDQLWREQRQLAIEMLAAVRDLRFVGNAIASALDVLAGKAADHRADVHALAEHLLADADAAEPCEETLARGVGERTLVFDFMRPRRLADEHHS